MQLLADNVAVRSVLRWAGRVAVVAGLTLSVYGVFVEPARLVVRKHALEIPHWPASLNGTRVVLISDIHAGAPFIKARKLQRIVEETNALQPDLILLLGDFVTTGVIGGKRIRPEEIAAAISGLRATSGVYAVLGNHDGWFDAPRVANALAARGIRVLRNESAVAGDLTLYGVADIRTDEPDLAPIKDLQPPVIVMTHSPDVFPRVPASASLTVAGHTHGGQIRLPIIGALLVPSMYGSRYAAGHIVERNGHLFVTTGVGTSILPVRIGVTPEITLLVLEARR